jgi:hypothetical protein
MGSRFRLICLLALSLGCNLYSDEPMPNSHAPQTASQRSNIGDTRTVDAGPALEDLIDPDLLARFSIPKKVLKDLQVRHRVLAPLKKLKTSRNSDEIRTALAKLQSILESKESKEEALLPPPSRVTLQLITELALASLDRKSEAYRLYDIEQGSAAAGALKAAKPNFALRPNDREMEALAGRFANTPSGLQALKMLALRALDQSEGDEATFYFDRMQAQGPLSPEHSVAALVAYKMSDSFDKAEHWVENLRHSGAKTVTLGGKSHVLEEITGSILAGIQRKKHDLAEKEKKKSNIDVFLKLAKTEEDRKKILKVMNPDSFRYHPFTFPAEGLEVTLGEKTHPVKVRFKKRFDTQLTPITQLQWSLVMGDNPSAFQKGEEQVMINGIKMLPNNPVETVGYEMAQEFIKKLKALDSGHNYDLPTDAQYEYAMRGGTGTEYFFGDDANGLGKYAWFLDNSGSRTHPVGEIEKNPFGLYDMAGNVWQWNRDWYADTLAAGDDPTGPTSGSDRVIRGGCWNGDARDARSASRSSCRPDFRSSHVGFRLVRTPE